MNTSEFYIVETITDEAATVEMSRADGCVVFELVEAC